MQSTVKDAAQGVVSAEFITSGNVERDTPSVKYVLLLQQDSLLYLNMAVA